MYLVSIFGDQFTKSQVNTILPRIVLSELHNERVNKSVEYFSSNCTILTNSIAKNTDGKCDKQSHKSRMLRMCIVLT